MATLCETILEIHRQWARKEGVGFGISNKFMLITTSHTKNRAPFMMSDRLREIEIHNDRASIGPAPVSS